MKRIFTTTMAVLLGGLMIPSVQAAVVYYQEDFDNGSFDINVNKPILSVQDILRDRVGPGNFFEVASGISHSGNYSLKFNYDGRNGICNLCGATTVTHMSGLTDGEYVVSSAGDDLTASPVLAQPGRLVFNVSRGFSKWEISSTTSQLATNDRLNLSLLQGSIDGSSSLIAGGDDVRVGRQCGVDGNVGGDIDRRSDCNLVIGYLNGLNQNNGQSIFRRFYFMIEQGAVLPFHQKLRYWATSNGAIYTNMRFEKNNAIIIVAAGTIGGPGLVKSNIILEKGTWYYLEEEFKAESSPGAADGTYKLWLSKSGEETTVPHIVIDNLPLDPVKKTSIWGNEQHWNDTHGAWYLDDYQISDQFNGAVVVNKPEPPQNVTVTPAP